MGLSMSHGKTKEQNENHTRRLVFYFIFGHLHFAFVFRFRRPHSQCAGAGFNLQHFYHQGDPVFQVWNCHKNHPQCLFSSPTVTPFYLI